MNKPLIILMILICIFGLTIIAIFFWENQFIGYIPPEEVCQTSCENINYKYYRFETGYRNSNFDCWCINKEETSTRQIY